jgi:hypothetical protein
MWWDWLSRSRERQRELEEGVDADLVAANRRRFKSCWTLFACTFLLGGIRALAKLSGLWDTIGFTVTMVFFVAGVPVGKWARAESAFLSKPNPEEPTRLWK